MKYPIHVYVARAWLGLIGFLVFSIIMIGIWAWAGWFGIVAVVAAGLTCWAADNVGD